MSLESSATVVKSTENGNGKSLYIERRENDLKSKRIICNTISIPLFEKRINVDDVMENLLKHVLVPEKKEPRMIHIDLTPEVIEGVDYLIFHIIILGCLKNSNGLVWRKLDCDLYMIETTAKQTNENESLDLLPSMTCCSPIESLQIVERSSKVTQCQMFDLNIIRTEVFQRPFHYLLKHQNVKEGADASKREVSPKQCVETVLKQCGIRNPSWATLTHFVKFLNTQLADFEQSDFLKQELSSDLPGFSEFVLNFLIQMSRDFALPSIKISDETLYQMKRSTSFNQDDSEIEQYTLRRTWENSHHDFLFFNPDHNTMTFLGFEVEDEKNIRKSPRSEDLLGRKTMRKDLYDALIFNRVDLNEDYDSLPRDQKISKLCQVMGLEIVFDPDPTYELTKDNAKKILAIFMRFRSGIPVIVMGETGCGKTRLIKFMCSLQSPVGEDNQFENLMLMKVHSGVRKTDIVEMVKKAENLANWNFKRYGEKKYTVLFFDETNTTELIGLVKEIMCDGTVLGDKISPLLKIVAACNPYRKHSREYLEKLEHAGLGYHVEHGKTMDRIGRIAMRTLVYRVQPLPCSMLPLVWDFGHLHSKAEEVYIKKMTENFVTRKELSAWREYVKPLSRILSAAQSFMRLRKDESSFVSLRNVQRTLIVMHWFFTNGKSYLFRRMKENAPRTMDISDATIAIVLALGVCYHASLKDRGAFREKVSEKFKHGLRLRYGADQMLHIIERCQDIFIENVTVRHNIAKNRALRENIFMMVICIELRIPLFVIGKPGSSKSLAKSVVSVSMQGKTSQNPFFQQFKQVHMITFQCSPLSAPEGIIGTFDEAIKYQKTKDLNRHVAVVVLEEIGLAEDSPKLPLKTLHSLLENDSYGEEITSSKVSFIGISNWALDPAKMNRGIYVHIENPDLHELVSSAEELCSPKEVKIFLRPLFKPLALSYLQLLNKNVKKREFFGLRDFYSLLKMISSFVDKRREKPTWTILKHCIKRNFGGTPDNWNPENTFAANLNTISKMELPNENYPDCSPIGLIEACLQSESDNRFLLLLTETTSVVEVLQERFLRKMNPVFIFGSSFPKEEEYIQVCRNINRIKICMEAGATVVLLNLENLYESLYDALNQYYAYFGGNRFVDLGLGTQKVKCRVHRKFRLIVVAETEVVYSEFPIPLINRLEKHFLHMSAMLSDFQQKVAQDLLRWVKRFVKSPIQRPELQHCKRDDEVRDTFIGFNADTCAAATLQAFSQTRKTDGERMDKSSFPNSDMESKEVFETEVLKCAQKLLLYSATPDGVLRSRSNFSTDEYMNIERIYFMEQKHEDFISFLGTLQSTGDMTFIQITTHSKLFSSSDKKTLCDGLKILPDDLSILNLLAFHTENNFRRKVRENIKKNSDNKKVLIVQCDNGTENGNLITCTRFCLWDQIQQVQKYRKGELHIVLIIHIPRLSGGYFAGFQCQQWRSVHLDDIRQDESSIGGEGSNTFGMLTSFSKCQTPEEQESYNIEKRLNLQHLIEYTAHTALSRVRDSDTNRSKERIEEIFPLLKNADFVHGIGKHLVFLMKEREVVCGQKIESWLYSDVTDKKYINKAGTFRKALNDCIREKLSPILAEIISAVDTNKNIRTLIKNPDPRSWKYKLWMEIANNPSATFMMYSKLTSSKFQDLGKALVVGTGVTGKIFDAVMPFSWIIFKSIGDVLQASKNTGSTSTTVVENVQRVSDILEKMPIGKILQSCLIAVNEPEYIEAYLQDFISMTYLAKCPEEERIVQTYIREKMKTFPNRRSTVEAIVSIHAIFDLYSCNLRNFSRLIQVWPTCTSVIARNMQTFHEELDILGLHLMLDHLEPGKNFSELDQRTKWQTDFHKFRGVIEDIIGQNISGKDTLELRKWRKCLVVDLFLQHCGSESSFGIKRVKVLWIMLRDKEDFKEVDGIKAVENFLTEVCMKQKIDELLGKGQVCQVCETSISEPPVHLQCNSIICQKCSNDMKLVESQECPSCHKQIPKGENHENQTINKKYQELQQFTRKINSFFIDLVSQLCFSEGSPPSRELIQKLMSYITLSNSKGATSRMITKQMSVFAGGIDPSPVLRSYLLQCLLKTNFEAVLEELQSFLTNGERLLESNGAKDVETMEQFFVLVINCFEDSFYQKVSQSGNRDDEELSIAIRFLKNAVNNAEPMTRDVKHLKCLAETKFGLSVAAKYLYDLFISKTVRTSQSIEYLLEATESICTKSEAKQPLFFLIKILCRTFGYESYSKILEAGGARMRWFYVPELHFMNKECCDRFIVCGNWYTEIRDNILQAAISRNKAPLHKEIDSLKLPRFQKKICVLLAVFKEITMSNLYPVMIRRINNEGVEFVWQCLAHHSVFQQKRQYLKQLSENRLFQNHMTIQEGMAIGHQSLVCLLLHFFIVMTELPSQYPIILPLFNLIHNPQSMLTSYLPTMPQDDFEVVQEAILAQRQGSNENPVFYECPNGHRYMIGDCGRPDSLGTCPECHADIGGRDHKLHRGNILNAGGDQTSKGHILGDPENRKLEAVPERKLSSIECGFLRLFIHFSMYLGATFHAQDTGNIIKPRRDQGHLLIFLWRHMEKDLAVVRKSIGKSLDDVYVLSHRICKDIMEKACSPAVSYRLKRDILESKEGRQLWETEFSKTFLIPVLQEAEVYLKDINGKLIKDKRLGTDPLMCLLHEIPIQSISKSMGTVWQYRERITIPSLLHKLETKGKKHEVLRMFLKEEHFLRALYQIPSIITLQKILIRRFQMQLGRKEAKTMTIGDLVEKMGGREGRVSGLVDNFLDAWNCVREQIHACSFPTENDMRKVPDIFCHKTVTRHDSALFLFPAYEGDGFCSYALLYYLLKKQNKIIEEYRILEGVSLYSEVPLKAVTSVDLIRCHPEKDMLPLILSNYQYSYEAGKGTTCECNFDALERQVKDRFLFSKPQIKIAFYEFEMMTFQSESTSATVFTELRRKIRQEPLNVSSADFICNEIEEYSDLCETLDKLDITIGFLKSMGGEPHMLLEQYMTQILLIQNGLPSQKAKSDCLCKHVQSLWVTLAFEKTKREALNKEETFDSITVVKFKEVLQREQKADLETAFKELYMEDMHHFLFLLFECITLIISKSQGENWDGINFLTWSIKDVLIGYMTTPQYDVDPQYPDWLTDFVNSFPETNNQKIFTNQVISAWLFIFDIYVAKCKNRGMHRV